MISIFRPGIVFVVPLLLIILIHTDAKVNGSEGGEISEFPKCSLELLESKTTLYTVDLTSSEDRDIICTPHSRFTGDSSKYIRCSQDTIHINSTFADRGYSKIRINCSDTNPLTYSQDGAPPFAGIKVNAKNFILSDSLTRYDVSVIFPDITGEKEEGLEIYEGMYQFSSSERNIEIRLNITSETTTTEVDPLSENFCIKISEDRMECEVKRSLYDVYFVNVGGDNPTETHLKKFCLEASLQNACGNKYPGTNCIQNRYCKKIQKFHQNGWARCTVDNVTKDVEYFQDINGDFHTNMSKMFEHQLLVKIEVDNSDSTLAIEFVDDESSEIDYSAETFTTNMTSNVNQQCKDDLTVAEYRSQPMPKLYDLEYNKFECHFTPYFFVTPVLWFAEWKNGTRTLLFTDYGDKTSKETKFTWRDSLLGSTKIEFKIGSSHLEFRTLLGMNALTCEMWYWNSTDRAKNRKEIDVLESRAPKFSSRQESHSHPYGETLKLKCHVASEPPPTITWEFGGRILEGILGRENGSLDTVSTLTIPKAGSSESGRYICTATNFRGSDKKVFIVDVYDNSKTLWLTLGITSIVLIILLAVTLAGLYKQFLKQRARLTKMEINEFINGNKNATQENDYGHINVKQMAYNTEYELAWNQFQLEQQELGKGVHGVVYKGKIGEIPIAVKTVREGVEKEVLMALLDELKIMIYLGQHDHVVNLKGACTQFLEEGRAYVMVEFCPFGSLESFLRKNRKNFCRQMFSGDYANSCSPTGDVKVNVQYFSGQTLSSWSHQIALGMQYLEEKKVIHGDLAIRNILLTSIDQVKITDFGLSRQLINTDTYVKKQQGLLPWKYMAIEAMREFRFTSKSDVWSYGVTIWEIFTLGSTPYPGMNWTPEFMQLLEDNMRLYKPKHATDEMYKVMLECWAPEPEDRPSFADLEMCLRKFP